MTKHKWHKEIKAWADGAEIEKRTIDCDWLKAPYPNWHTDANVEYRIRPQPKEPQYIKVYGYLENQNICFQQQIGMPYIGKIPLIVESMMTKDEALKMQFEAWFESQYKRKPCPNVKAGDEPHDSTYMTMFADGLWKGWQTAYKIYGEQ